MRRLWMLLCLLCLPLCALAQEEELDTLFAQFHTLGASVAVFQNGEITYTHVYGSRDLQGNPVTVDTAFQVGSISKMISNIGLMQLLEAKGLSLDTELGDVLGYPVRHPDDPHTPITLRMLMTHTASLRDGGDYNRALEGDPILLQQLFTTRAGWTFHAGVRPGTKRLYSNFGGGLIGSLMERISGQTVDGYMNEHVFQPLGITAAYQAALMPGEALLADLVHMPSRRLARRLADETLLTAVPDAERDYVLTAGKLIISAPDLCRLLIALCDGGESGGVRILSEQAAQAMVRDGLFLNIITNDQVEGRTLYGHGGKALGMLCAAYFDPSDRTGVVMLTNGCNNLRVRNGVGLLGRRVLTWCYEHIIEPTHTVLSPYAVAESSGLFGAGRGAWLLLPHNVL